MGEGRRVVAWTTSARDSLDEILGFIASDSPEAASKVLDVVARCGGVIVTLLRARPGRPRN